MSAVAVFTSAVGSHAFQERRIMLTEPAKIGRSVAQARPITSNAVFDCKVLSRNHALLWYDNGRFYLQDTKSSNGTFVNSQRLSKGSEESAPKEIYSGDTIQFGVDVMENSRKVTHNCIIATIQLFHPGGQEATNSNSMANDVVSHGLKSNELYQLAQCLQEALHREQALEKKLTDLQRLLQQTQEATECGWQALVDEDRLLSRLECLEDQLSVFAKGVTEDSLLCQMLELQSDKAKYESSTKDSLRHLLEEKLEAVRKVYDLERALTSAEEECAHQHEVCRQLEDELRLLNDRCELQNVEVAELNDKLREVECKNVSEQTVLKEENHRLQAHLEAVIVQVESLQAENDFASEQLINMKSKLDCMKNAESPRIYDCISRGIQADIMSLADLRALNNIEKSDIDDEDEDEEEKVDNCHLESDDQPFITLISANDNADRHTLHAASGDEVRKLRSKLSTYKAQLNAYTSQLEDTQTLVSMLQQDLQNAELEKISQAKRIECLEDELQTVELEKSSQYEKLMLLEAQVKSLLTELDHRRLTTNAATTVGAATHDVTTSNGELDIESVHLALEWETFRNKAEFQQLKMECAELRQRVQDIEQEMKQSRRQNDELKADYVRLQESYRQLEQLKLNVEERENACHVNLTDAQKDIELTRIQLSTAQQELSELRAKHHDEVSALRSQLDDALDEYSILAYNSTVVSYCSSIPLAILLFVIAIAFHPLLSMLTATRSPT